VKTIAISAPTILSSVLPFVARRADAYIIVEIHRIDRAQTKSASGENQRSMFRTLDRFSCGDKTDHGNWIEHEAVATRLFAKIERRIRASY
jgi:hypothetical protein